MNSSEHEDSAGRLAADLQALRQASLRGLPVIPPSVPVLPARRARGGGLVSTIRSKNLRPWPVTVLAVVALAAALLIIPVSYTRTTGYEARLDFPKGLGATTPDMVISQVQKVLHAGNVSFSQNQGSPAMSLIARLPAGSASKMAAATQAFAKALDERGIPTACSLSPITEKVSANLYAWAADRVVEIRVNREGKTDAQIAEEIKAQLAAAGFQDPSVAVSTEGGQTRIEIHEKTDGSMGSCPQTNVVLEGGSKTSGPQYKVMIRPDHPMTDEELKLEAEKQLREQGLQADVQVVNGHITITPKK